jgi:hypothetical protein
MRFRMFRCWSAPAAGACDERRSRTGAVPERRPADGLRVMANKNQRVPAAVRTVWHLAGSGQK